MKWIRRYNESGIIKATDDTINRIICNEVYNLGYDVDLNHIDVSEVTNMFNLIDRNFNGNISLWNVQNVMVMSRMFSYSKFNGDISRWNVGNVKNMDGMFLDSQFNGDISGWNVQNVTNMSHIFYDSHFDGDISNWNVHNVENMLNAFHWSPLKGREPWWYVLSPLFGSPYLMWDSMDFEWIDLEGKVIYRGKLIKTFRRGYNTEWNGELPPVFGFTYK